MKKLTQAEFYKLYGKEEIVFCSYYKYLFSYKGKTKNGDEIKVHFGGDSDDIYRHNVEVGQKETLESVFPSWGSVSRDGKTIHEFDER